MGNILQYVFPALVGLGDIVSDVSSGKYSRATEKAILIGSLILIQNRGTFILKKIFKKPRPSFPNDFESFPSGHMMIATQCMTRVFWAYSGFIPRSLAVACSAIIALGRYIPGRHDATDLCVGGLIGIALGGVWNHYIFS